MNLEHFPILIFRKADQNSADDWLKINIGQYGYYRVQYPLSEWQKFSRILQTSPDQLSSSDRTSKEGNSALELLFTNFIKFSSVLIWVY